MPGPRLSVLERIDQDQLSADELRVVARAARAYRNGVLGGRAADAIVSRSVPGIRRQLALMRLVTEWKEEELPTRAKDMERGDRIREHVRAALRDAPDATADELYAALPAKLREGLQAKSFGSYYVPPIRKAIREERENEAERPSRPEGGLDEPEAETMTPTEDAREPERESDSEGDIPATQPREAGVRVESEPAPAAKVIAFQGPGGRLTARERSPGMWNLQIDVSADFQTVDDVSGALYGLILHREDTRR